MKGLDLRRLKKVSSDDKTTVFRHDNGHELKIAHARLSPEMLKDLKALPMRGGKGQKMADGGEPDPTPNQSPDDDSSDSAQNGQPPVNININAQPQPQPNASPDWQGSSGVADSSGGAQAAAPTPPTPGQEAASASDQTDQVRQPAEAPEQQTNAPAPEDPSQQPELQAPSAPATPQQAYQGNMENLSTENAAFAQDLNSGHITPETYSDLFAKKSTLGKIGMVFGLLVGGAGSGLAHQQNALLGAMNQEINNDLEAQKLSKANAQNWLRLSQQHQQLMAENKVRGQQAGLISQQTKTSQIEAQVNAQALASSRMQYSVLHNLYEKNAMLPAGPQKALGDQMLQGVSQAVDQNVANQSHQASSAVAQAHSLYGNQGEQEFNNENKAWLLSGKPEMDQYAESHHIPGVPGQTSVAVPQDVRSQLNAQSILDTKGKDLLGYIKQNSGSWNPQTRAVATQKLEEMKNFYNDSISGGALTQGRLGWYDQQFAKNPTDILPQLLGSTAKLEEMVRSNESRMNQTVSSYGGKPAQPSPSSGSGQQSASNEKGQTSVSKSGKPIVLRNGKWVYQ